MKKILLGSHRKGNIGHSFMSFGMSEALRYSYKDIDIVQIEQHEHFSILNSASPFRLFDKIPHGRVRFIREFFLTNLGKKLSEMMTMDLSDFNGFIECGGPNLRPHVYESVEMRLMYHYQLELISKQNIPCLDLGVGSCVPYGSGYELFDNNDIGFWQRVFQNTKVTSVRDELGVQIFSKFGRVPELIPCAAFLSSAHWEKKGIHNNRNCNYFIINYQKLGSNESWGLDINEINWRNCVVQLYQYLKSKSKIVFLCHNQIEKELAESLNLDADIVLPNNLDEYGELISNAQAAVVNRIHAAIPIASFGIPSICIGNDSRLGAIKLLGLSTYFTNSMTTDLLIHEADRLLSQSDSEYHRLRQLREQTFEKYDVLFKQKLL